jgi:isoleucyl-tRNA synthetase
MALFPDAAMLEGLANPALMEDWQKLRVLRDQANVEIERQRKGKVIGTSLGARLTVEAAGEDYERLQRYAPDLPTLFIVSEVVVVRGSDGPPRFAAERATGVKCDRCWRYVPRISSEPGREGLCDRCGDALGEPVAS